MLRFTAYVHHNTLDSCVCPFESCIFSSSARQQFCAACLLAAGLAQICHRFEASLIVDEAHGSHFVFHPEFPQVIYIMWVGYCSDGNRQTTSKQQRCL